MVQWVCQDGYGGWGPLLSVTNTFAGQWAVGAESGCAPGGAGDQDKVCDAGAMRSAAACGEASNQTPCERTVPSHSRTFRRAVCAALWRLATCQVHRRVFAGVPKGTALGCFVAKASPGPPLTLNRQPPAVMPQPPAGGWPTQPPPRSGHRNCRNVPERFAGTL